MYKLYINIIVKLKYILLSMKELDKHYISKFFNNLFIFIVRLVTNTKIL